jgi:hypothetical protein
LSWSRAGVEIAVGMMADSGQRVEIVVGIMADSGQQAEKLAITEFLGKADKINENACSAICLLPMEHCLWASPIVLHWPRQCCSDLSYVSGCRTEQG